MQKEIIIVIIIVIAIISADILTQRYTRNSFDNINNQLDEIRTIGKELEEIKETEDMNSTFQEKKKQLEEKIEKMQKDWKKINRTTAFYIEHDELEKVNASMTKFKSYFELEEYTEAIPELEDCKFILNHIKDKEAMQFINLF
ncbi:MAG: DUF4363 family protein [Clostridia bacterium]